MFRIIAHRTAIRFCGMCTFIQIHTRHTQANTFASVNTVHGVRRIWQKIHFVSPILFLRTKTHIDTGKSGSLRYYFVLYATHRSIYTEPQWEFWSACDVSTRFYKFNSNNYYYLLLLLLVWYARSFACIMFCIVLDSFGLYLVFGLYTCNKTFACCIVFFFFLYIRRWCDDGVVLMWGREPV